MVSHWCLLVALLLGGSPQTGIAESDGGTLRFDPGLVDVNGVYVVVDIRQFPLAEPNDSAFASDLGERIRARLDEAGIPVVEPTMEQGGEALGRILSRRLGVDPNTLSFYRADVPALHITIDLVSPEVQTSMAMYVRAFFSRQVGLSGQVLQATVWSAVPMVQAVPVASWQEVAQRAVAVQVDAFIAARKTAATQDGKTPLRARASTVRNTAALSSYPYVASKGSSVFHRADCRMAGNIAPENLVGYNSREDAVAAGKRPCKTCDP